MRRRASGLPAGETFDAWDSVASQIPAATQRALRTLEMDGMPAGEAGAGEAAVLRVPFSHPGASEALTVGQVACPGRGAR